VKNHKISFVGAGKVATALCLELCRSGFEIQQVSSKTVENCRRLAKSVNATWSPEPYFPNDTDIIFVAVPDDSLKTILKEIKCDDHTIVVHTAGSVGLDVFPSDLKHTGVFYPLQTFSEGRKLDFSGIHIFIESDDRDTSVILKNIADKLKSQSHFIKTENRQLLHVAAVFVNNFTNFMLISGKEIASKAGFTFEVLKPLIVETISKAFEIGPEKSQTGPAVRSDVGTINYHIKLLSFSPDLQKVYSEISKSIERSNKICK
jgi:predicted short-subunit dehydrogenase-like oxidoreductase (DUF2520 family)